MPTMNEHFVEESMRLASYRGNADDNGGAEPEYPPARDAAKFFRWLSMNLHSIRSLMPEDREREPHYGQWGMSTVLTFADQTQATIHAAWAEDQINVREGDEERPSFLNWPDPDPPGERWAVLHPASDCGLEYFNRMEALQREGQTGSNSLRH